MTYAAKTTVPVERTISEIQRLVRDAGGANWSYTELDHERPPRSVVQFRLEGYLLRLAVQHPTVEEVEETPSGRKRSMDAAWSALERERARRWRVAAFLTKAQLTALAEGMTVEEVMLQNIVIPHVDVTVRQWMEPQLPLLRKGEGTLRALPPAPSSRVTITEESR